MDIFCKSKSRLYRTWNNMKGRCYRPKSNPSYPNYGGRGIKVCDEWLNNFEAFQDWALHNGYEDNLTIDRINVNGNYEPSNCRWVTVSEQNRNQRKRKPYVKHKKIMLDINGIVKSREDWCKEYNVSVQLFSYRVKTKGMSVEEALTSERFAQGRPRIK